MNRHEFIETANKLRLSNRGQWIQLIKTIENKQVRLKSFDTWIQILEIGNSVRYSNPMDQKVSEWKRFLTNTLHDELNRED